MDPTVGLQPTNNAGILSKANLFLKSSAKRIAHRTESISGLSGQVSNFSTRTDLALDASDSVPSAYTSAAASTSTPSFFADQNGSPSRQLKHAPSYPATNLAPSPLLRQEASTDSLTSGAPRTRGPSASVSTADLTQLPEGEEMVAPTSTDEGGRGGPNGRNIDVSEALINFQKSAGTAVGGPAIANSFNPATVYQHIQEMAAKRVSTLDYLRRA